MAPKDAVAGEGFVQSQKSRMRRDRGVSMHYGATDAQRPSSDIRWWKDVQSTSAMAERLARSHVDKHELESRIAELLEENNILKLRCTVAATELTDERQRLIGEIATLQAQIANAQQAREKAGVGAREAESAARDRLLKDEFERKVQELQVEVKRERLKYAEQMHAVKQKMANCICGDIRIDDSEETPAAWAGLPARWVIRNSK